MDQTFVPEEEIGQVVERALGLDIEDDSDMAAQIGEWFPDPGAEIQEEN